MKKKIGLGIIASMLVAGAFVFANNATQKDSSTCPNRPGCVCPKAKTEQTAQATEQKAQSTVSTDKKEGCDNDPNCICK